MSDENSENSSARFVMPVLLAIIGITILSFTPGASALSVSIVETIGFGLFTTGAFSFMIIYNHARNPVPSDDVIVNSAQALVVYGGLLSALLYQQILTLGSVTVATTSVFVFGMLVTVYTEMRSD